MPFDRQPKVISHRGNLTGPHKAENSHTSIDNAISLGFDVEIDIWRVGLDYYLGHDGPDCHVDIKFLQDRKHNLWIHCKNLLALLSLCDSDLETFWHQTDDFTLTKNNLIWTFPGKPITQKSVIVALGEKEARDMISQMPYGICTDYPVAISNFLEV